MEALPDWNHSFQIWPAMRSAAFSLRSRLSCVNRSSSRCPLVCGGFAGSVAVEVATRRARSRVEREEALGEALAFARQHLAAGSTVNAL